MKCIDDEIPFEIPDGWKWVRLGDLAQYKKGPFGSSITKAMFVPDTPDAIKVYEQKNAINKDASLGTYFITNEKYETLKSFEVFPGDIIVSCAGTIGEAYVLPDGMRKGIINQALMKISLYDKRMLDYYLIYFDQELKLSAKEEGHGIALKNIPPFDVLKKYLVAIPPYEEQQRIVDLVNKLLIFIDNIDDNKKKLEETITNTKAKILDLAIRGKLIPQNPNEEPASVLLERIQAEKEELIKQGKLKRDKKESIIYKGDDNSYYEKLSDGTMKCIEDEIPFEIPESWEWARFRNISLLMSGTTYPVDKELKTGNCMYVKVADMNLPENEYEITTSSRYINDYNENNLVPTNSVIFPKRGGAILTNKKRLVLKKPILVDLNTMVFTPIHPMKLLFCYYWFLSFDLGELNSGSSVPQINNKDIEPLLIPIPPSEEQVRISTMLEKMFSVISDIEDGIK